VTLRFSLFSIFSILDIDITVSILHVCQAPLFFFLGYFTAPYKSSLLLLLTGWYRFLFMIEHVMPLCLTISWVYTVAMLVQSVVYEKEQRLKEVRLCNTCILHTLCWQHCNRPHPIPVASTFPKIFVKSTYLYPKLSVDVRIRGLQPIATRCH